LALRSKVMHRSSQPQRRTSMLPGTPGIVILVFICILLSTGVAFATVRLLGTDQGAGTRAAGADDITRSPASSGSRFHGAASAHASLPVQSPIVKPSPPGSRAPSTTPPQGSKATPTQPAAPANCTNPHFVTSDPSGGWSVGRYYVYNNMWNMNGYDGTQTLYACSYRNWYVVANMNNDRNDGAVKTYPNVHEDFNERAISSFHSISSTFAETSPRAGIYEDAYDIWINGIARSGSTEVMIWNENHNQVPGGSVEGAVTFGGRTYKVWKNGDNYIAFVANTTFTSGTLNLLKVFDWIIAKGWIPASSTLGQIDYGAEIVSTRGTPATFAFTNFVVNSS
jgi:Glycosyl hydrolase family 12